MAASPSDNPLYFSPKEMMAQAEYFALSKTTKSTSMTLGLAVMAGAFIGIAFLFYITVTTGSSLENWGLSRLAGGIAFSLGLILIVIGGGELFTSSVLSSISLANRQITWGQMLKTWGKVYVGNFMGATLLLALVMGAGMYTLNQGQWGLNALSLAQHKVHHSFLQAFSLGVLCNLLVCLAIWLTFSSTNAMTKAVMTILPVAMFVSSGFEHCVANMFMVPLGIAITHVAPESFWTAIGATPAQFADLNLGQFVTANLIPVTLGNIVGGAVLVGLANWSIYRRPELKATETSVISTPISLSSVKEYTMNNVITVEQIMDTNPVTLRPEMPLVAALDHLIDHHCVSAPVVNVDNQLVGFLSVQDVMVDLWCQDYLPSKGQRVADLMKQDIIAVSQQERLVDVVEYLAIDKDQLYPTTAMGISTRMAAMTLEERAREMQVSKPQVLPVIDNGQLVGVVSRWEVMNELRKIYGERVELVASNELVSA